MASGVELKEDKSEGDQLVKDIGGLTLDDDEVNNSTQESVSMRDMHFTNGDWYPKEKPKSSEITDLPDDHAEVPSVTQGKKTADKIRADLLEGDDESQEDGDENEVDDLAKYRDEETGEVPRSFFEVLMRECSKIPYTPEEAQERRNDGHKERNKMLLEGIKTNHREWFYQIEEMLALEMMNRTRKSLKKARKEEKRLAAAAQDPLIHPSV